jgi:hypothetical protein
MGLAPFILFLAVRSEAIDTQKGWSDWLSEGQAFRVPWRKPMLKPVDLPNPKPRIGARSVWSKKNEGQASLEGSAQKLAVVRGCLALTLKNQKRYWMHS